MAPAGTPRPIRIRRFDSVSGSVPRRTTGARPPPVELRGLLGPVRSLPSSTTRASQGIGSSTRKRWANPTSSGRCPVARARADSTRTKPHPRRSPDAGERAGGQHADRRHHIEQEPPVPVGTASGPRPGGGPRRPRRAAGRAARAGPGGARPRPGRTGGAGRPAGPGYAGASRTAGRGPARRAPAGRRAGGSRPGAAPRSPAPRAIRRRVGPSGSGIAIRESACPPMTWPRDGQTSGRPSPAPSRTPTQRAGAEDQGQSDRRHRRRTGLERPWRPDDPAGPGDGDEDPAPRADQRRQEHQGRRADVSPRPLPLARPIDTPGREDDQRGVERVGLDVGVPAVEVEVGRHQPGGDRPRPSAPQLPAQLHLRRRGQGRRRHLEPDDPG